MPIREILILAFGYSLILFGVLCEFRDLRNVKPIKTPRKRKTSKRTKKTSIKN